MIRLTRVKDSRSLDLGFGVSVVVKPLSFALWRAASSFGEQAPTLTVVPENLDQVTALSTKDEQVAAMGVPLQRLLHLQGEPVEAAAHVGHARRQPHPTERESSPIQNIENPPQSLGVDGAHHPQQPVPRSISIMPDRHSRA